MHSVNVAIASLPLPHTYTDTDGQIRANEGPCPR